MLKKVEYNDILTNDIDHDAKSVYDLLKHRLSRRLKRIYELHGFGISEEYEDTIDDFFLYLYDSSPEGVDKPFAILDTIRNKDALCSWMLSTYRNFLLNKAKQENRRRALLERVRVLHHDDEPRLTEENMIHILADAIAYADQQFPLRNLFVFYRMLLSYLDHHRAIPQEKMASALDMNPVTYRVCNKRLKDRLRELILWIEAGYPLALDETHLKMRDRMVEGFNQFYQLLLEYYNNTLERLPSAKRVQSLRDEYGCAKGMDMHETLQYGTWRIGEVTSLFQALRNPQLPETDHGRAPTHRLRNGPFAR